MYQMLTNFASNSPSITSTTAAVQPLSIRSLNDHQSKPLKRLAHHHHHKRPRLAKMTSE